VDAAQKERIVGITTEFQLTMIALVKQITLKTFLGELDMDLIKMILQELARSIKSAGPFFSKVYNFRWILLNRKKP